MSCSSCRLRAAGAGALSQFSTVIDADGARSHIPKNAHPARSLFEEKYYFAPVTSRAIRVTNGIPASTDSGMEQRIRDIGVLICWDQWYPKQRASRRCSVQDPFYPTAIGWHPARRRRSEKAGRRVATDSVRTRLRTACSAAQTVWGSSRWWHDGLEFFGQSFICDPFGAISRRAARNRKCWWHRATAPDRGN